jgi:hypothetical protein
MSRDALHERPGERSRHAVETYGVALLVLLMLATIALAVHLL